MACVKENAARPVKEDLEYALKLLQEWDDWAQCVYNPAPLYISERTQKFLRERGKS